MKQFIILRPFGVISFLFINSIIYAQVVFVRQDAMGSNDGTSWENAYNDLENALAGLYDSSELWIAKGTYHPGGLSPDSSSVFAIRTNISIYGGFNGTETNLNDRDPVNNLTILSGDINNDDVTNDFSTNKSDNTLHVIYVDSLLKPVVIDGITIKGGNTSDAGNAIIYNRSGGGIYAMSPVIINQCYFTENFGREGGAIYCDNKASTSRIVNCIFSYNKTSQRGAGLYAASANDILISNSSFVNNQTVRGAIYPFFCSNIKVENCLFEDNHSTTFNGGAIFSFQNIDLTIRDCDFIRNSAIAGGAIVVNGSQLPMDTLSNIRIEQCRFYENKANEKGGSIFCLSNPDIYIQDCLFTADSARAGGSVFIEEPLSNLTDTTKIRIDSCIFTGNISGTSGGAMFLLNASAKIEDCIFDNDISNDSTNYNGGGHVYQNCPGQHIIYRDVIFKNGKSMLNGGAATAYGNKANYLFENCTFNNNYASNIGGAVSNSANSTFSKCIFEDNTSNSAGGALSMVEDSSTLSIQNSLFNRNISAASGAISCTNGSNHLTIDRSEFYANKSTVHCGVITSLEDEGVDFGAVQIRNSIFGFNETSNYAGVLDVRASDTEITNSVFYENTCTGPVGGGVFYLFTLNNATMKAALINNTIVNNHGLAGDGLVLSTTDTASELIVTIQNCIFKNQGSSNFVREAGTPVLRSLGGNMSDDFSMSDILTHSKDLNLVEPVFNNTDEFDFSLTNNSPGIDGGVIEDAPEFDILGNPRVNAPDMGAYENQMPVSLKNHILHHDLLLVYPNPVRDQNPNGTMNNTWRGNFKIQLSDIEGRIVYRDEFQKSENKIQFNLPMEKLRTGMYQVHVSNGQNTICKKVIKIE